MKPVVLIIGLALLSGCTIDNSVTSPILAKGRQVGQITFAVQRKPFSDSTIVATESNGEVYTGMPIPKITEVQTESDGSTTVSIEHYKYKTRSGKTKSGWMPGIDFDDDDDDDSTVTYIPGQYTSTLIGNRGHSLTCDFTTIPPSSAFFVNGADGKCLKSDGSTIPFHMPEETRIIEQ